MVIKAHIQRTRMAIGDPAKGGSCPNGTNYTKLLTTAFLIVLSVVALRAQTATTNPQPATAAAGYLAVFPQAPLIAIRFDGNSEDIAKVLAVSHAGTSYNHDGTAFKSFVRSTSSESYNGNVVDYDQRNKNVLQYKRNVKSGKWIGFANGE